MPSPFEGLTQEEADKKFIEIGEEHARIFEKVFAEIQNEILKYDPTYILAVNSFYSTFDSNVTATRRADRKGILQYHIELLQGLTLRNKIDAFDFRFAGLTPRISGAARDNQGTMRTSLRGLRWMRC
jgi:hypothetical protein